MEIKHVCVLGGSGFIGRNLVQLLSARGYTVRVPTRSRERAKALILLPTVEVIDADITEPKTLARVARGTDALINLVGTLHDRRGKGGFEELHVELARKVVAVCDQLGVSRLLHMSALGAHRDGRSRYQHSKAVAEDIVRGSGLDWTIFRPSVVVGRGDRFLNVFAEVLKFLPVMVVASPDARLQPVSVEDVTQAFVIGLTAPEASRRVYELCGPRVYTLRELVALTGSLTGRQRPIIGLNSKLSYLQAMALEMLPGKLMTRDNYYSLQSDNTCSEPFPFGIKPTPVEQVAAAYLLGGYATRARSHSDKRSTMNLAQRQR